MNHSKLVDFFKNHSYLNGHGSTYKTSMMHVVSSDNLLSGHNLLAALKSEGDFVDFFEDANPRLKKRHLKPFFFILRAGAQTLEHASFFALVSPR
jgi:hypothetical protein